MPPRLEIEPAVVRRLIYQQFPQWSGWPITTVPGPGTVNAIFRIGDRYVARFPLHDADPDVTRKLQDAEDYAAREIQGTTRFPTPAPVAKGQPSLGYPLTWTVNTWLPGLPASDQDPGRSFDYARDLAELVLGLRAVNTCGRTFQGTNRGGELTRHDVWVAECLRRFQPSPDLVDCEWLRTTWAALRVLPRTADDVMTHGDLIPANLLVDGDRLIGVLDVGQFQAADPALDLVAGWHGLETGPRQVFRDFLRCDELEWLRGAAWAFEQALGLVLYGDSNPTASALGRRTLARLAADLQI